VAPGPAVEHFNVIEDISRARSLVLYMCFLIRSFFSELKKDSAIALTLLRQEWAIGVGEGLIKSMDRVDDNVAL